LASPRRPHLPSHTTSLPSPRSSSSSFSSSTSPSTTSLPPVPRHYAPSKVKSFDSALGSRSGHQHDDLDWGYALPSTRVRWCACGGACVRCVANSVGLQRRGPAQSLWRRR
jgi:hypothetical protein